MKLFIFAASHRKESYNRKLARLAASIAVHEGVEVDFAEYAELDLPMYNNDRHTTDALPDALMKLSERLASVQGLVIASPEYNWSVPGSLKNILDWLSLVMPNPLAGKTAFLMSASPSLKGGVIGLVHLQAPLASLEVLVYPRMHTLSQAKLAFQGENLKDFKQMELFETMMKGYIEMTRALNR